MFPTFPEHVCDFARERNRHVSHYVVGFISYASFGGVRHNEAEFGRKDIVEIAVIFVSRRHHVGNRRYVACLALWLAVLYAFENDVIESVLGLEPLDGGIGVKTGRDDCDVGIKHTFFVGNVDLPVYESAEEVAFTELQNAHGAFFIWSRLAAQLFEFHYFAGLMILYLGTRAFIMHQPMR